VWDEVDQEQARFAFDGVPVVWEDAEVDEEEDEISSVFDDHRSFH